MEEDHKSVSYRLALSGGTKTAEPLSASLPSKIAKA